MANSNNKEWDNHVKGRDPSLSEEDRQRRSNGQYEGDIFLKNQDTPDSTAIAIRDSSISIHSGEGKVGVLVKGTGSIVAQGKIVLKSSGRNIIKGNFTENAMSFIKITDIGGAAGVAVPHVHTIHPAYLFRFPNTELIMGLEKMLETFKNI